MKPFIFLSGALCAVGFDVLLSNWPIGVLVLVASGAAWWVGGWR